jgi:hypothetical protein
MTSAAVKWKWATGQQESFDQIKALMAKETLVTFPDFTNEFEGVGIQLNYRLFSRKTDVCFPVSHQ